MSAPRWPAVEWQVAGACNYDCSYCIQSPRYRRGRPSAEALDAAIRAFSRLPGVWEVKCSGGEAFAHPLFLDLAVPGLVARTPHHLSVLTNLSASEAELSRFLEIVGARLRVFSASLHLEHVDAPAFARKAAWLQKQLPVEAGLVINQVVLPGRVAEAAATREVVVSHGLRWYPQLFKHKGPDGRMRVADYPDIDALRALIGDRPGPTEANVAPSYQGRMCWAGARYFTVDKDGVAWRCRSSKREGDAPIGSLFEGTLALKEGPSPCPYALCTCSVPANRGMVAGVGAGASEEEA